jgi:hypothetical protein
MPIRNDRSTGKLTTHNEYDPLYCRMLMLGLDLYAIEVEDSETFDKIKQRCTRCGFQEACAIDLKRNPNSLVWETYCPNSETLYGLTETWWLTH